MCFFRWYYLTLRTGAFILENNLQYFFNRRCILYYMVMKVNNSNNENIFMCFIKHISNLFNLYRADKQKMTMDDVERDLRNVKLNTSSSKKSYRYLYRNS